MWEFPPDSSLGERNSSSRSPRFLSEPGPSRCGLPARWSPSTPDWPEIRIGIWRARFYQPSGRPVVMGKATRLLIKNGTLIDGSGAPVPNRLLVVEGNRITLVGETDG